MRIILPAFAREVGKRKKLLRSTLRPETRVDFSRLIRRKLQSHGSDEWGRRYEEAAELGQCQAACFINKISLAVEEANTHIMRKVFLCAIAKLGCTTSLIEHFSK